MKQFFGAFFGSVIGLVIAFVVAAIIFVAMIRSTFDSAFSKKDKEEATAVKKNSVLRLELDGPIYDRQKQNPFEGLNGIGPFTADDGLGMNELLKKIASAKTDDRIKGIYLDFKHLMAGFAVVEELRGALEDFKKSGKFIYSYAESYSHKSYYLASVSDKVFLNPQGAMQWQGLAMNMMFFKNTFEKLDIEMQVFRHGKFKSAVEPFLLDKMSQANRLQSETFLNSIWNTMVDGISKERKISALELNRMANTLAIRFPEDALGTLIDEACYEDEVQTRIKNKIGLKATDKFKFVSMGDYEARSKVVKSASKIAVIYANGSINSGEGTDEEIGSDRIAKAIKDARQDDKIKAIVLRVNSPGGSALASDVIWREVMLAKKAKPTVVSMSDLAASGGYYISCAADHIFAQPNTITGSIGVFGMIPNLQKMLAKKLGITVDTVNTNKYSDIGSGLRPATAYEYNYIQNGVERVYDTFTKRVAEGRHMSQAEVDSIGQGRVWTGSDALKIKLVDELGGLNDAIAYAAKKAGLKEYKLTELPKQKNPFEMFMGNKESEMESRIIKRNLGSTYLYYKQVQNLLDLKGIQMRLPFEMAIE